MIRVREVMSRDVVSVAVHDTIRHAAQHMAYYDVGALPVCERGRLVGIVTDRDLTVRALAGEVLTRRPVSCRDDEDLDAVQQRMAEARIRRTPVVDGQGRLVGMLSLGDIATRAGGASREEVSNTLERVSQPGR
ncbi:MULTISPECIES: CBS domain-containing protein [unclassified Burkholderia]|uniref:CBS domain-containing protein n=1 Tax=unclassified Burkholderia TaxID=2613784 RepID=UPI00141E7DB4|nr:MULTISPECIES: CBS domain-containing protein [unclassified Burkholderia]NIE84689.1 CBS domain-containing protein [Burkholderia sp. Tr-860]NIF63376.1 CBS domain-containing protein [Burkholderia sp. Cy-647]NIF98626.1 CBS domain-containing protein [Burkholderia sp. Ax-1720]